MNANRMKTSRIVKQRSIVVLIVAAVLLELTVAVQYFSVRRSLTTQLREKAQDDLNETDQTEQLINQVECTIKDMMPDVRRLVMSGDEQRLEQLLSQTIRGVPQIVGIDFCYVSADEGQNRGVYYYEADTLGTIAKQPIAFDYTQRSWYIKGLTSDNYWSEPYDSRYYEVLMSTCSSAVRDDSGKTIAVIGVDVPMDELSVLTAQIYDNLDHSLLPIILIHLFGLLALAFIIQRSIHNEQRLQMVKTEKERIEGELNIAHGIQQAMLSKTFPPYPDRTDIDVYASLTPAHEVGGDFYDILIRDEKLFFCIGDVSGKGVPASLLMSVALSVYRMLITRETAPERILSALNDTMMRKNDYNMFITFFIGVLDLPTGRLRYSNAGHKAPVVLRPGEAPRILDIDSNLPVGAMTEWPYTAQETMLEPRTLLFLYTDGLTEAEDASHQLFESERMLAHLKYDTPDKVIAHMTEAVITFVGDTEQSDDLTMLAVDYTRQQVAATLSSSLQLSNDVSETPRLASFVEEVCEKLGFSLADTIHINLAIEEAVVNVIKYAYPPSAPGRITVEASANSERLTFVITDEGQPFDPTTRGEVDTTLPAEERSIGGLGIHLIRRYMDSINYERHHGHNILTLHKDINKTTKI